MTCVGIHDEFPFVMLYNTYMIARKEENVNAPKAQIQNSEGKMQNKMFFSKIPLKNSQFFDKVLYSAQNQERNPP